MTSSHHRRLPWKRKEQRSGIDNDEIPLIQENASGLESKFAEFDQILSSSNRWSIGDFGASRGNDGDFPNNDSDGEGRDESHLLDLQRELEAAELGTALSSFREQDQAPVQEEREDSLLGHPTTASDQQSLSFTKSSDSFDVEVAIEKIKLQKKAMQKLEDCGESEAAAENVRFAQFVAQMEHDFDGAILSMMEGDSVAAPEEADNTLDAKKRGADQDICREELVRSSPLHLMTTVGVELAEKDNTDIHEDEGYDDEIHSDEGYDDENTDFTPFSAPDFPSDESRATGTSQPESCEDQQTMLCYYTSINAADLISPLTNYESQTSTCPLDEEYNRPEELPKQCIDTQHSIAPCSTANENQESTVALKEKQTIEVSHLVAQNQVDVQSGTDGDRTYHDECDNIGGAEEWWRPFRKSKHPVLGATFLSLFLLMIQILAFRALVGMLLDYHQSTTNLLHPSGSLSSCQADSGCLRATPVALNDNGEYEVFAATKLVKSANELQHDTCEGSWSRSPAIWFALTGDGSKHTAIAIPTSEDFDVSIMVLEGVCNQPNIQYGPSTCCGESGESSLVWDTVEGREYFIAVFGSQTNTTGSFRMNMWNSQRTKNALSDHVEERQVTSFQDLAVGGSIGISMTFLGAVALAA